MPPSRRRPVPPPPPARRPRVAGLRHPEPTKPADSESADRQQAESQVAAKPALVTPAPVDTPAPVETPAPPSSVDPADATDTPSPVDTAVEPETPDHSAQPESAEDAEELTPTVPADWLAQPARRHTMRVPLVLAAVAVVLGGLATWFGIAAANARDSAATNNTAWTDNVGTSEVSGQVKSAVAAIFSYNYTNTDKTKQAAQQWLTGVALCQYKQLFAQVEQQAPAQQLVLTTTVADAGVQLLQGNKASVLLFLNQSDHSIKSGSQGVTAQAVLGVNAEKVGNDWKITNLNTFNGQSAPQNCS